MKPRRSTDRILDANLNRAAEGLRVVEDICRQKAREAIFVDLNLIADKRYAAALFEALIPLKIQWYGLATTLLCDDRKLAQKQ